MIMIGCLKPKFFRVRQPIVIPNVDRNTISNIPTSEGDHLSYGGGDVVPTPRGRGVVVNFEEVCIMEVFSFKDSRAKILMIGYDFP
ncbi:hypothetical protein FRX31_034817 [Thalictrum thalictroides]|uniref:Uncharacterized protein n=1 Tax=Thalictrum thalictroides TaxID=46969 RepID=A0A7J6UTV6_THATH|nr:hypothetical protein FRX31_034817 [Thalictrum thalictroides]